MRIKCTIIRKNRTVKTKNVESNRKEFYFNNGIYLINKTSVNLQIKLKDNSNIPEIKTVPELYYFEGDPLPVNMENRGDAGKYLDGLLMENALIILSEARGMLGEVLREYLHDPLKIIILFFALVVAYSLTNFMLGV